MANAKKKRPMTKQEKAFRAEVREKMRTDGLLPPKKMPLNRKKFIKEAREDFEKTPGAFVHLAEACGCMMGGFRPTLESVGAAKVMKVACEITRFYNELEREGQARTLGELYDRIRPILDA